MAKKDYVSVSEFCAEAGMTPQRLYQLWAASKGPPRERFKLPGEGWRVKLPKAEALDWLEQHRASIQEMHKKRAELYRAAWREAHA
ncbi:hypothetical protein ACFOW6_17765 [Fodinicurvata halophila]|uniref:Helix-turn-helix domain-containing protein n=1 Tax=Fodinicurvata halophila TaxID=1419723 RepID=A0ABV8UQW4_9PROT